MISMASQYPFNRDVAEEEAEIVETDEDVAQVEAEAEEVILVPEVDAIIVEARTESETAPIGMRMRNMR